MCVVMSGSQLSLPLLSHLCEECIMYLNTWASNYSEAAAAASNSRIPIGRAITRCEGHRRESLASADGFMTSRTTHRWVCEGEAQETMKANERMRWPITMDSIGATKDLRCFHWTTVFGLAMFNWHLQTKRWHTNYFMAFEHPVMVCRNLRVKPDKLRYLRLIFSRNVW